jgi:hypothetical protein
MVGMAQEIEQLDGTKRFGSEWVGRMNSLFLSKLEDDRSRDQPEGPNIHASQPSNSILNALGDEFSRRILISSIASGKTVEEISAEEDLPLSTCYRRVRRFVDEGLMIPEKIVVTQTGKRYAVYRTSFSGVTVTLNAGKVAVETTPNADVLDKLFRKWLLTNYPTQNQDDAYLEKVEA